MTVKELKEILNGMSDEQKVCYQYYGNTEVNGYFLDSKDGKEALILTDLRVQPRV